MSVKPCSCTNACQGQASLDAEGADRFCRMRGTIEDAYARGHEDGWNEGYEKGFEDGGNGETSFTYTGIGASTTAVNFTIATNTTSPTTP